MPPSPIFLSTLYSPTMKPGTRSVDGGGSSTGACATAIAALAGAGATAAMPPVGGAYVASISTVSDHPSSGHAVTLSGHCLLHLRQRRMVPSQEVPRFIVADRS